MINYNKVPQKRKLLSSFKLTLKVFGKNTFNSRFKILSAKEKQINFLVFWKETPFYFRKINI